MKKSIFLLISSLIMVNTAALADGLLMPNDTDYPADFLRHRATVVDVEIEELYATTVVYQEFVNDWTLETDAVWSFPLPYDARSIKLLYTRNDTVYQAILIESTQSTNPGTGEGGVAALVNDYMGVNGLRLQLRDIAPGAIQQIELHYVSLVDFFQGEVRYTYPLDTEDLTDYPIEHLELNVQVHSDRNISDFEMPSHPYFEQSSPNSNELQVEMVQPNAFLNRDLSFSYRLANNAFGRDFYSALNSQVDGHFAFFLTPPNIVGLESLLHRRIVFLLSNSASMAGYKLEASVTAIQLALDQLSETDYFNIVNYNYYTNRWRTSLVAATAANITSAKSYLDGLAASGGNRLDLGINTALAQFTDNSYHNAILAFTDGRSPLDPIAISNSNSNDVAIFPIAIGRDVDHSRLDMTARLNLGFVTYLDEESNLSNEMLRVFEIINTPVFNQVSLNFNKNDVHSILPETAPNTYAGLYSLHTGRYETAGGSTLNYSGNGVVGPQQYDFALDFSNDTTEWDIAAYLWAKAALDALEQQIDIYGETPALKDSSVALSLRYQMRCRYTAYFADYENVATEIDGVEPTIPDESAVLRAFPNPFNPLTNFHIVLGEEALTTPFMLNIYDLKGRLVASIDLSHLGPGHHWIPWLAFSDSGANLNSGVYLAMLVSDTRHGRPMKVLLLK